MYLRKAPLLWKCVTSLQGGGWTKQIIVLNCNRNNNAVTDWALVRAKVWGYPHSEQGVVCTVCGATWPVNAPLIQGTVESQWCPGCLCYLAESQPSRRTQTVNGMDHHHGITMSLTSITMREAQTPTAIHCWAALYVPSSWHDLNTQLNTSAINSQLIARAKNTSCINSELIIMLIAHSTSTQN
jgi:hypothetical protein